MGNWQKLLGRFFKTRQRVSCSVLARDVDPHSSYATKIGSHSNDLVLTCDFISMLIPKNFVVKKKKS